MTNDIDILGPIFHYWISQLDGKIRFMDRQHSSKFLFCARAGKRIKDHLDVFTGGETPYETDVFAISRIIASKAALGGLAAYGPAMDVCNESFGKNSIGDAAAAFLKHYSNSDDPRLGELMRLSNSFNWDNFRVLLAANDPGARFLKEYLAENRSALEAYLRAISGSHDRLVLIDTGWKASIQRLLQETYPDFSFAGLYFGTMDARPLSDRHHVVFDALRYDADRPETCFALHRHLIESILEPKAPSIEEVIGGPCENIAQNQLAAVMQEDPSRDAEIADRQFLQILDYTEAHRRESVSKTLEAYGKAISELERILITPERDEVPFFAGKNRSKDFGRDGYVPVLLDVNDGAKPEDRIADSLWPAGQAALEFPPAQARKQQGALRGSQTSQNYFAGFAGATEGDLNTDPFGWENSVAIVTRTKDRPVLLKRAMESVANQTHRNFTWVIVNDGGDEAPVREIIEASPIDRRRIRLVSNAESVGMEAASNLGVRAVDSEFVVIHDDDDSWEPSFLERCVSFLQAPQSISAKFDGVITRAVRISEEIDGDEVIIHERKKFQPWVNDVTLFQMAVGNFFAPISFVYRRSVYDDIGGYLEHLPVLGDWRFNIDFLARTNIGLIDEYLSNYHHRDVKGRTSGSVYENSVIGGQSVHAKYTPVVMNELVRDPDLPHNIGVALAQAHSLRVLEHRFNMQDEKLREMERKLRNEENAPDTPSQDEDDKALFGFQPVDREHVTACLLRAFQDDPSGEHSERVKAALGKLGALDQAHVREEIIRSLPWLITNPDNFDHIAYLGKRSDIWATEFNGINELTPYHHYLIRGIDQGEARPTRGGKA